MTQRQSDIFRIWSGVSGILLFVSLLIFLSACDYKNNILDVHDPDVIEPLTSEFNLAELRPGQHIAGILQIDLNYINREFKILRVEFYIDDQFIQGVDLGPFDFTLDTRQWPNGDHEIKFLIWDQNSELGLINLIDTPRLVLYKNLVFDQAAPTPVDLTGSDWSETYPEISWTANSDDNFYLYNVWRTDFSGKRELVGTLRNPAIDHFVDSTATQYFGRRVLNYQVEVDNRAESVFGDSLWQDFGTAIAGQATQRPQIIESRDEAYLIGVDSLLIISLKNQRRLNGMPLREVAFDNVYDILEFRIDGGRDELLLFSKYSDSSDPARFLLRISAGDLVWQETIALPEGSETFEVNNIGEIFAVDTGGNLHIIRSDDSDIVIPDISLSGNVRMTISEGRQFLYIADLTGLGIDEQITFRSINFGKSVPEVVDTRTEMGVNILYNFQASPKADLLYLRLGQHGVQDKTISIWSAGDLADIANIFIPVSENEQILDIFAANDRVYLSYTNDSTFDNAPGLLVEYDELNFQYIRNWRFVTAPNFISLISSRDQLYTFGFSQKYQHSNWVVPLH